MEHEKSISLKLKEDFSKDLGSSLLQEFNLLLQEQAAFKKETLSYIFLSNQDLIMDILNGEPDEEGYITVEAEEIFIKNFFIGFLEREIEDFKDIEEYGDYVEEVQLLKKDIAEKL